VAGQPGDDLLPFQRMEGAALWQQHRVTAAFLHIGDRAAADVQVAFALRPGIQDGLAGALGISGGAIT
jgi:hypothetical protein